MILDIVSTLWLVYFAANAACLRSNFSGRSTTIVSIIAIVSSLWAAARIWTFPS